MPKLSATTEPLKGLGGGSPNHSDALRTARVNDPARGCCAPERPRAVLPRATLTLAWIESDRPSRELPHARPPLA